MTTHPDNAAVTAVELRPAPSAVLSIDEWERRAAHTGANLERDGFPAAELAEALRAFRFRDEAGVFCCYDGTDWFTWREPSWVEGRPTGALHMQPFTMDVASVPPAPSRGVDRRVTAVRGEVEAGVRSIVVESDPFQHGVHVRAALRINPERDAAADAIAAEHELAAPGDVRVTRTTAGMTIARTLVQPIDAEADVVEFAKSALALADRLWGSPVPDPEQEIPS